MVFAGAGILAAVVLPRDSLTFWTHAVFTSSRVGDLAALGNQSVNGMLLRIPATASARDLALPLLVTVAVCAALYRARVLYRQERTVEAAITCGCAALVASPVSWTHHQVWTVLAALALLTRSAPHRAIAALVLTVMCVRLPHPAVNAIAGFLADNARAIAALGICCLGLVSAWRTARTPELVLFNRITVRSRSMAVVGATGLLISGAVVITHLINVRFPKLDSQIIAETTPTMGTSIDERGRVVIAGADVDGADADYGFILLPDGMTRVIGFVGKDVARLVLTTAKNGPTHDVPLTPQAGKRMFVFDINYYAESQLDTYTANGKLGVSLQSR